MSTARLRLFFDGYRAAFARFDRDALLECFAFPLHVVSASEGSVAISVSDRDEWPAVLDGLPHAYRTLGVVDAEQVECSVTDVTPQLSSGRVLWRLRRSDGTVVYDFTAIYTLVEIGEVVAIAAIAHDELPKMQAALTDARIESDARRPAMGSRGNEDQPPCEALEPSRDSRQERLGA